MATDTLTLVLANLVIVIKDMVTDTGTEMDTVMDMDIITELLADAEETYLTVMEDLEMLTVL